MYNYYFIFYKSHDSFSYMIVTFNYIVLITVKKPYTCITLSIIYNLQLNILSFINKTKINYECYLVKVQDFTTKKQN